MFSAGLCLMLKKFVAASLRPFNTGTPGERFRRRYYARRQSGRGVFTKYFGILSGGIIMAAGVFFMPAPGPGMVILAIGATIAARESLLAARALDWTEVLVRKLWGKARRFWKKAPVWLKILMVLLILASLAGFGWLLWLLLPEKLLPEKLKPF